MPRGKRKARSLAHMERELHALNARRHSILAEMATAVERMSVEAMTQMARIGQATGLGAELPTDNRGGRAARTSGVVTRSKALRKTPSPATKR